MFAIVLYFMLSNGHVHVVNTQDQMTFPSYAQCRDALPQVKSHISLRPAEGEVDFTAKCVVIRS